MQRPDGMFTQLLDEPGTYRELTSVCMVGYAVARGVRLGWLDESWRPSPKAFGAPPQSESA